MVSVLRPPGKERRGGETESSPFASPFLLPLRTLFISQSKPHQATPAPHLGSAQLLTSVAATLSLFDFGFKEKKYELLGVCANSECCCATAASRTLRPSVRATLTLSAAPLGSGIVMATGPSFILRQTPICV